MAHEHTGPDYEESLSGDCAKLVDEFDAGKPRGFPGHVLPPVLLAVSGDEEDVRLPVQCLIEELPPDQVVPGRLRITLLSVLEILVAGWNPGVCPLLCPGDLLGVALLVEGTSDPPVEQGLQLPDHRVRVGVAHAEDSGPVRLFAEDPVEVAVDILDPAECVVEGFGNFPVAAGVNTGDPLVDDFSRIADGLFQGFPRDC